MKMGCRGSLTIAWQPCRHHYEQPAAWKAGHLVLLAFNAIAAWTNALVLSVAQTSNYQEMAISQRSGKENIRENERVQQEANVHEAEEV
jgi:uncharacterized protein YpmS